MYLIINLVSTEVVWKLWEHSRSTTVQVRQLRARSIEVHANKDPFIADGGKERTESATYVVIIVDGAPVAYKLC